MTAHFGISDPMRICDFGCGPGLSTTRFAEEGADVTRIDLSDRSIRYAEGVAREKNLSIRFEDLRDFIKCYNAENRHNRKATWSEDNPNGRWRSYDYEELMQRDKVSLDIFWLKDESLEDTENLPEPDVIAQEIIENLEAALEQFSSIYEDLTVE